MIHPRVIIVNILRLLRLNRFVAKIYYKHFHRFNSNGGKELPGVIEKCFNKTLEFGTCDK